jgi:hypothetical protein
MDILEWLWKIWNSTDDSDDLDLFILNTTRSLNHMETIPQVARLLPL